MDNAEILRGLKEALRLVTIDDIVVVFNEKGIDYLGMSDMEMYIKFFEVALDNKVT